MSRKLLIVILIIALLGSFGGYWYWKTVTAKPFALRFGYYRTAGCAPYWVAADKGFFNDEGLNVTLIEMPSAPKIIEAAVAGSLDMGTAGLFSTAQAFEAGINLRIANDGGHVDQDHEGTFIVVRKNSTIQSVSDLKGKTIAIPGWGTISDMALRLLLSKYNLTIADVNIVILSSEKQIAALIGGRIDVATLSEPFLTYALDTGDFTKLHPTTSWIFPDHKFQLATTFFLKSFLDEHRDVVNAFIKAYARAVGWMNDHPDETREIIAKYTGLDIKLVGRMQAYAFSRQLDSELVDRCLSLMWEAGFLKQKIKAVDIMYVP